MHLQMLGSKFHLADWLIISFAALSVALTFQFNWWSEGPFWQFDWWGGVKQIGYWYPLGLAFFCIILRVFNQNYLKIALIILGSSYVLVASIAPIFSLLVIYLTAFLLGRYMAEVLKLNVDNDPIIFSALGLSLMGLLITIASHFKINYSQIYLIAFIGVDIYLLKKYKFGIRNIKHLLSENNAPDKKLYMFFGILLTGILLHLFFLALMVDMGHDSLSTHLTIPRRISEAHIWSYNVNEYIWSVAPMGADMLYVPAYMLGGEDGIRLLNISFLIGVACLIYKHCYQIFGSMKIASALAISYLSLPIIYYSLGQVFIEPCYAFFMAVVFYLLLRDRIEWMLVAILLGYAVSIKFTALIFCPLILLIYLYDFGLMRKETYKNIPKLMCIFLLFSAITFAYAYIVTGNPFFPLMNEVFKSELMFKNDFYNTYYLNRDGLSTVWLFIFNSKKYGEFYSSSGALGIFYSIFIPTSLILICSNLKNRIKPFLLLVAFIFYVAVVFHTQTYLRYIFSALPIIFFVTASALQGIKINKVLFVSILGLIGSVNFIKSSSASSAFRAAPIQFYLSNEGRQNYAVSNFPFASIGELLKKLPEFKNKKILLIGYGVDPIYYHYPKETEAYTWHSLNTFNTINEYGGNLNYAMKKLGVEVIVCPEKQHLDDEFKFSDQCKKYSNKIFSLNGVFVGRVIEAEF